MPRALACIGACLGYFIVIVDTTAVVVALPAIGTGTQSAMGTLQWVSDAYLLAFAAFLLPGGYCSDRVGPSCSMALGVMLFMASSVGCGLAQSGLVLVFCRAGQGIGAALLMPASLSIIGRIFEGGQLHAATAIWTAIGGVGATIAPVFADILLRLFDWHAIFWINVPICVLTLSLICFSPLRATSRTTVPFLRLSLVGCAVCSLVASAFIVPREPGPGIVLSIVAVSLVAVTFGIDDKAQSPLFGLLQHRQSATMIVAGLLLTFAFNGQFFLVALVAPEHFSASQSSVTLVYSVEAIGAIVGSVVAGLVMRGDSPGRACAGGYLTALAGSLTLIYSFAAVDFSALVAGASLMGFATDMAVAGLTASILTTTRQDSPGLAQSLFSASRQVGGALGVAVYGSVANATSALWVGVLCSVVCIGLLCGQAQRSRCR